MLRALAQPQRPSQLLCAFWITQQLHSFTRLVPAVKPAVVLGLAISCSKAEPLCWLSASADAVRSLAAVDTQVHVHAGGY